MECSGYLVLAVTFLFFYLIYDYWHRSYFRRLGIPEAPNSLPFFGNFLGFRVGVFSYFRSTAQACGKVYGMYNFSTPTLVISDPDVLREILVRDFSSFHDRRKGLVKDAPFDKALLNLRGERWKRVRNTVTPAFSANKLKKMLPLIQTCCDNLLNNLQADVDAGKTTEMKRTFGSLTLDTIACCAFGMDVNSQKEPNHPFVVKAKEIFSFSAATPRIFVIFAFPFLRPLCDLLDIGLLSGKLRRYFVSVIEKTIQMRKEADSQKRDMLQLLMNAHKDRLEGNEEEVEGDLNQTEANEHVGLSERKIYKEPLTTEEIVAQSTAFFFAGYETTNIALVFTTYCMAINPDCQQRVQEEIDKFCPDRDSVTYENLNKLEYLEMCLWETLRMYPPGIVSDRLCNETVTVKGMTFPTGMEIFFAIGALHYDTDYWEEPEKFNPERFTKENKDKRHPYAFLPFGAGPRNCIGMRFALVEIKIAIVRALQKFTFEPCAETDIPPKPGKQSMAPPDGITLRVTPRK